MSYSVRDTMSSTLLYPTRVGEPWTSILLCTRLNRNKLYSFIRSIDRFSCSRSLILSSVPLSTEISDYHARAHIRSAQIVSGLLYVTTIFVVVHEQSLNVLMPE